jgi:uncharacterized protein (TIGR02001 family)
MKLSHASTTRPLFLMAAMAALPALAEESPHTLSGNVGVTSDYIFRGVTQTQHEPAIQGGVDYSHKSGLYLGAWASNVSWVSEGIPGGYKDNNSLEIDLYGGYKGALDDLGYDLGLIHYYYPGDTIAGATTPDTTEVYLGASWKFLSLKYSHVVSDYFIAWGGPSGSGVSANQKTRGSGYIDLSLGYPLADGWAVLAHLGHQNVENYDDASYTDWKLGISKDIGFGTLTLAYTDSDGKLKDAGNNDVYRWNGKQVANGRVALTFFKSF